MARSRRWRLSTVLGDDGSWHFARLGRGAPEQMLTRADVNRVFQDPESARRVTAVILRAWETKLKSMGA